MNIGNDITSRPVSQQPMTRYIQWGTYLETMQAAAAFKYPVYRRRSDHDVQHVVLTYLVGRWRLVGLLYRVQ